MFYCYTRDSLFHTTDKRIKNQNVISLHKSHIYSHVINYKILVNCFGVLHVVYMLKLSYLNEFLQGEFQYVTYFTSIAGGTVGFSLFFWVTHRRYVSKH